MSMAVKFADNIALINTSNSIDHFEREVKHLHQWCEEHFLWINMRKTKELLIDFRRKAEPVPSLVLNEEIVERVSSYKTSGPSSIAG